MGNLIIKKIRTKAINFKAASPTDVDQIEGFINQQGIEKCVELIDDLPELSQFLDDERIEFPDDDVDVPAFIHDLTPEQGASIVQIVMQYATAV